MSADWPPRGQGLPIGNLTSQFWGNLYLSELDHALRRELHVPHAQRYMDDIAVFADEPARLVEVREFVADWLWRERRQRLKDPAAPVRSTRRPVVYLGQRVGRWRVEPTDAALARMGVRIGAAMRSPDPGKVERTIASYRGVLGLGGWGDGIVREDGSC